MLNALTVKPVVVDGKWLWRPTEFESQTSPGLEKAWRHRQHLTCIRTQGKEVVISHWGLNQTCLPVLEGLLEGLLGNETPFCCTQLWQRSKTTFTSPSADAPWTEIKSNFGDVCFCDTHTYTYVIGVFFFCLFLINWHFIKPRTVSKNCKFQLKQK